jgi:hypothetical protein
MHQGDRPRAALYDPDSDELHIVASGDAIGLRSVDSVARDRVTIREGSLVRTLALDPKPGAPP